jgi:hypothetical protein
MHASIGRGTVRCTIAGELSPTAADQLGALQATETLILESGPASLWEKTSPSATADRVSMNLKKAFDPLGILNPGILGPVTGGTLD